MQKTITLILLVVAIGVQAQTRIKSKALGDSITIQKSAFEIAPIIVTPQGDTARSLYWYTTAIGRDTTIGFNVVVNMYDKYGVVLTTISNAIPGNVWAHWLLFTSKMDVFILNQRRRFVKE